MNTVLFFTVMLYFIIDVCRSLGLHEGTHESAQQAHEQQLRMHDLKTSISFRA